MAMQVKNSVSALLQYAYVPLVKDNETGVEYLNIDFIGPSYGNVDSKVYYWECRHSDLSWTTTKIVRVRLVIDEEGIENE